MTAEYFIKKCQSPDMPRLEMIHISKWWTMRSQRWSFNKCRNWSRTFRKIPFSSMTRFFLIMKRWNWRSSCPRMTAKSICSKYASIPLESRLIKARVEIASISFKTDIKDIWCVWHQLVLTKSCCFNQRRITSDTLKNSIRASSIRIHWQHTDVGTENRYLLYTKICIFPKLNKNGLSNTSTKDELLKDGSEKMSTKKYWKHATWTIIFLTCSMENWELQIGWSSKMTIEISDQE